MGSLLTIKITEIHNYETVLKYIYAEIIVKIPMR